MNTNNTYETGMFRDRTSAEDAIDRLYGLGYNKDDVSVIMDDKTKQKEFAHETGTKSAEGAVTGGLVGGALGALVAGFTATGSILAIAGTGGAAAPLVAGPLAAALAGLGAGGIVGGVVGALVGLGIPEDKAREYEQGLQAGGIVLGVRPRDEHRSQVRDVFGETTLGDRSSTGTFERGTAYTYDTDESQGIGTPHNPNKI